MAISVDGTKVRVLSEKDPANLPWKNMDIDLLRRLHNQQHHPARGGHEPSQKFRRGRAAAQSIVPSTMGAAGARHCLVVICTGWCVASITSRHRLLSGSTKFRVDTTRRMGT